ncbi:MAG: GTPase domain-containing protein [Pseudanabaenaceae cyanobacterium SKYGB_i_bin29]|nr:GTPase domain-containing protein [Pseudanabaenaceae cyanobacterium SKYG29]MDW8420814.1 GTPase domain-containing protein [Pseudanabaenaceae cyanobacterium SKYGB_i_bin29]
MNDLPQFFSPGHELTNNGRIESLADRVLPLHLLVMGKVSTGKSSLLNALLGKARKNSPFKVRAESGVTQTLERWQLNPYLCLIDTPGLDYLHNSDWQLPPIDVGIFVVAGSADGRQRQHLDRLRELCPRVVVVLNKIDQYDKWQPFVLDRVMEQWRQALGIERIFPTCTFGFDPELDLSVQLDLRGIEDLKAELEKLLGSRWQERQKRKQVSLSTLVGIVTPTIRSIAESGSTSRRSPFIPGLLAIALGELHQLYYGRSLAGQETHQLLQILPSRGWYWLAEDNHFLLNTDRLRLAVLDSLALLVGAIQAWSSQQPLTPQLWETIRSNLSAYLEPELPSYWTKTIEDILTNQSVAAT